MGGEGQNVSCDFGGWGGKRTIERALKTQFLEASESGISLVYYHRWGCPNLFGEGFYGMFSPPLTFASHIHTHTKHTHTHTQHTHTHTKHTHTHTHKTHTHTQNTHTHTHTQNTHTHKTHTHTKHTHTHKTQKHTHTHTHTQNTQKNTQKKHTHTCQHIMCAIIACRSFHHACCQRRLRNLAFPLPHLCFFLILKISASSEAQQRYFSYRAILEAIVSQNSFVFVFMGYRTIIAR